MRRVIDDRPSGIANWANDSGRDGLGVASFVASGNSADGTAANRRWRSWGVNVGPGDWVFEWRHSKNATVTQRADTAWLAYVRFPDNTTVERFETLGLPAGWSTTTFTRHNS